MKTLLEYKRESLTEITTKGYVVWVHGRKVIHICGGNPLLFGRSLIKPYQMKALKEELKNLTPEQKAISVSSHSGEDIHIKKAQSLLEEKHWHFLKTPTTASMGITDPKAEQTSFHHPCSGKHMAILIGCQKKRLGLEKL